MSVIINVRREDHIIEYQLSDSTTTRRLNIVLDQIGEVVRDGNEMRIDITDDESGDCSMQTYKYEEDIIPAPRQWAAANIGHAITYRPDDVEEDNIQHAHSNLLDKILGIIGHWNADGTWVQDM